MVSEETLISCFSNLGCEITDSAVINKCTELCIIYDLEQEAFVESWMAYTVPNSLEIKPTIDGLKKFEEEDLRNRSNDPIEASQAISDIKNGVQANEERIYIFVINNYSSNVLDMYSTGPPITPKQVKRARSPTTETGNDSKLRAVDLTFTPAYYGSQPNVPNRAPSATASGKVLLNFGPVLKNWKKQNDNEIAISKADVPHMPKDATYMFQLHRQQARAMAARCLTLGERLCNAWKEAEPNSTALYVRNVASVSQTPFRTFGKIVVHFDKTTNNKSILLQGCKRLRGCYIFPIVWLDLSAVKHYSVFPGQVVAVEGTSVTGDVLIVKQLFVKAPPLFDAPTLAKDIRIYVAIGPFTASDNLFYQPLWDLTERVAEDEPDVLILVGPFVDCSNSEIKKCTLKDSFQGLFDNVMAKILQHLQGKTTRVVLVASNRDVHHDPIYPTPEFTINTNKLGPSSANLCSMPDPCIINVNGLHVGITSVDILRHLGQSEISNTSGMDRMGRLASHVLSQATFYPLHPPLRGLNYDQVLWTKYGCFEKQPHISILPSDIKHFCKAVNECLVVNPERLQKYSYAKLCVRPTYNGTWDPNKVTCEMAKV